MKKQFKWEEKDNSPLLVEGKFNWIENERSSLFVSNGWRAYCCFRDSLWHWEVIHQDALNDFSWFTSGENKLRFCGEPVLDRNYAKWLCEQILNKVLKQ